eukprot:TRINITY_DN16553_c0_g2_i1.p1 TRINITY_DN16553_c0_g2~~TRINITY_DN16553_c0_g2_i1.p1  ORF type:complete len:1029 (+),score=154.21 TRINITY_DN16553_c0_g2_i1:79-3165(+)
MNQVPPTSSSPVSRSCATSCRETMSVLCRGNCPFDDVKRVSLFEYTAERDDAQQMIREGSSSGMLAVSSTFHTRGWGQPTEIPIISSHPGDERPPQFDQQHQGQNAVQILDAGFDAGAQEQIVQVSVDKFLEHASEASVHSMSMQSSGSSGGIACSSASLPPTPRSRRSSLRSASSRTSSANAPTVKLKSGILVGRLLSEDWYDKPTASFLRRVLLSKACELFSMFVLLLALFLADLFELGQASDNTVLDAALLVCFVLFALEIVLFSLAMEFYPMNFFFWMDLIGALSLMFDISWLLGGDGTATQIYAGADTASQSTKDQGVLARASRVAKQASRAGRMSRILKLLRHLPFLATAPSDERQAARAISEKLTVNLATRVAFLTVCLVVVLPLFGMFVYPEVEGSLSAHALLLSTDIAMYQIATSELLRADLLARVNLEVQRMITLYSDFKAPYGPFQMCAKLSSTAGSFNCDVGGRGVSFDPSFNEPRRRSSIVEVTAENVKLMFDMSSVRQYESLGNVCFILVTLILMIATCFFLSSSVSLTVLRPLERVFAIVRVHCAEIVKVTARFHEAGKVHQDVDMDLLEEDEASEVILLEKVFARISGVLPKDLLGASVAHNEEDAKMLTNFTGQQFVAMTGRGSLISLPSAELRVRASSTFESDVEYATLPVQYKDAIEEHSFNLWQVPEEHRRTLIAYAISSCKFCYDWTRTCLPKTILDNFIGTVQNNYRPNAFHNFEHAFDVTVEVRRYLYDLKHSLFEEETYMWLLVAALGHDIGHLGVNNLFLVETAHEYALTYNDRSPLENLHCCLLFQVLGKEETNVFKSLSKEKFKRVKGHMVDAILHTDMVKHNDAIKDLGIMYTLNTEAFLNDENQLEEIFKEEEQHRRTVLNALLHTADVSNPMKPWDLCQLLADKCLEEFFAQGDQEKAMGIPVQMLNDRSKVNRPNSQVGFIEFVIAPLAYQMATVFPCLAYLTTRTGNNMRNWAFSWKDASNPTEEEWQKVKTRMDKVRLKCEQIAAEAAGKLAGPS